MSATPVAADSDATMQPVRRGLSRVALVLAILLFAATYLLISPPTGQTYPGAIPWREGSLLKKIIEGMSLGGSVASIRGVEIKDLAFHLAVAAGLVLLAVRCALLGVRLPKRGEVRAPWLAAQLLLLGWVALSALSAFWSRDADISLGQAALYGFGLAWALVMAWTLEARDVQRLLAGLIAASAVGAALCVWYYHERNPFHRPGFPIGNPGTLGASLLPAILASLGMLAEAVHRRMRHGGALPWARIVGVGLALIPLLWCTRLTSSRAAMVGLVVGLAVAVFIQVRRRTRWVVILTVAVLGLVAFGWMYSSRLELAMARGATVRFRLYAWRYATELWQQRPVSGVGAGSYTRLAAWHSIHDRALDPGAFMGQLVEHAHNELFEILAEIGLLGGLTFVGGYVATFSAGAILLSTRIGRRRRWLVTVLMASLAALLADAMFGVGLRLPGVPPIFYGLLGALWAVSRCAARERDADVERTIAAMTRGVSGGARSAAPVRAGAAALGLAVAVAAGWLALRTWAGVQHEYRADVAYRSGNYAEADRLLLAAEPRLLDPSRKLEANKRRVLSCFELALEEVANWRELDADAANDSANSSEQSATSGPIAEAARQRAIEQCSETYRSAAALSRRAPTFGRMTAIGAKCAELLADLHRGVDFRAAREWLQRAEQAWRFERLQRPYDVETLLALTRYPASVGDHVALLRDALRSGFTPEQQRGWLEALGRLANDPRFAGTLEEFVRAAAPLDPQSDLDSLVASMAPEAYRLAAAWKFANRDFAGAEDDTAHAAALYEPMRVRFPTLYSVTLAYQAEYAFRARPSEPAESIELLRRAIDSLPDIQEQKYEELVGPFRMYLARYLLAAGRESEAVEVVRRMVGDETLIAPAVADLYAGLAGTFVRTPPAERPPVRVWIDAALRWRPDDWRAWSWRAWLAAEAGDTKGVAATLREAAMSGVHDARLRVIREMLAQEFSDTAAGSPE